MRLISCVLLLGISACSKKESPPRPNPIATGPEPAVGATGSGSDSAPNPAPSPPKMTTERFFEEQYSAFLQTRRGVLLAVGDDAPEHLCGPELGTAMVRLGAIAANARDDARPEDCAARGDHTYCTFTRPGADPKADPDSVASYVFDDSDPPVLVAVWIGSAVSRATELERELVKPRECKRPSID